MLLYSLCAFVSYFIVAVGWIVSCKAESAHFDSEQLIFGLALLTLLVPLLWWALIPITLLGFVIKYTSDFIFAKFVEPRITERRNL